jgi:hypothetical protein
VSLLSTASAAESSPGAIVGIITDAARVPVVHVTVTALRADGRAIRATVSGSDGVFSFADLPPGAWSISVELEGYPRITVPALEVVAGKAARYDVAMGSTTPVRSSLVGTATDAVTAPTPVNAATVPEAGSGLASAASARTPDF